MQNYFLRMGGIGAGAFLSPKERAVFTGSFFLVGGFGGISNGLLMTILDWRKELPPVLDVDPEVEWVFMVR